MSEPRPLHVELAGSEVRTTVIRDDEWAQIESRRAVEVAAVESADAARRADLATVAERAAQDPAFAALARLIGLATHEGGTK